MDNEDAAKPQQRAQNALTGSHKNQTGGESREDGSEQKQTRQNDKAGARKRALPLQISSGDFWQRSVVATCGSIPGSPFGHTASLTTSSAASAPRGAGPDRERKNTSKRRDRIRTALTVVATLLEHDDAYLPIFLRLERELEAEDRRTAALDRARSLRRPPR